jgi:hypothetical protein
MLLMLWSPLKTNPSKKILAIIEIGLNHEEQHQELTILNISWETNLHFLRMKIVLNQS